MGSSTEDSPEAEEGLSAVLGARLPLARQQVFGFEVEDVTVGLALPALTVHVLLRVLHHELGLLYHLRKEQREDTESQENKTLQYQGI